MIFYSTSTISSRYLAFDDKDCHLNLRLGRLSLSLVTLLLSKNPHQKLCDHVLSPFERSLGIFLLKAVVLNNRAQGQFLPKMNTSKKTLESNQI